MSYNERYYELIIEEVRSTRSVFLTVASINAAVLAVAFTQFSGLEILVGGFAVFQALGFYMPLYLLGRLRLTAWQYLEYSYSGTDREATELDIDLLHPMPPVLRMSDGIVLMAFLGLFLFINSLALFDEDSALAAGSFMGATLSTISLWFLSLGAPDSYPGKRLIEKISHHIQQWLN